MHISRNVTYGVHCPHCGQNTPQTVAWLTVHNDMACDNCSRTINLESGDNAVVIQKLSQQCASIDAALAKPE